MIVPRFRIILYVDYEPVWSMELRHVGAPRKLFGKMHCSRRAVTPRTRDVAARLSTILVFDNQILAQALGLALSDRESWLP